MWHKKRDHGAFWVPKYIFTTFLLSTNSSAYYALGINSWNWEPAFIMNVPVVIKSCQPLIVISALVFIRKGIKPHASELKVNSPLSRLYIKKTTRERERVRPWLCLLVCYHRRPVGRVCADGGSSGAGDSGDGVQRLADVDVEVWRFVTLFQGLVWRDTTKRIQTEMWKQNIFPWMFRPLNDAHGWSSSLAYDA